MKMPIVAMLIAIGTALPAPARSQVNVNVNIGQPPVVVAQPVLVPVQASPVYYAPSYDQGEMDERPRPKPKASRISDNAAAATAPPRIAPHDSARSDAVGPCVTAPRAPTVAMASMFSLMSVWRA